MGGSVWCCRKGKGKVKKVASIDIGTNTALLLIAEISEEGHIHPLMQREEIVRLGENVDESKNLRVEAVARVLAVVEKYRELVDKFQAEAVVISGTSAVRDAGNRHLLLDKIHSLLGTELQVLSGDEEAVLTYFGALSNKPELQNEIFLIDIGGGSTECILGTQHSIDYAVSLDIGSVRLTERIVRSDPITDGELEEMLNIISDHLPRFPTNLRLTSRDFVGVAGTITTLAAMHFQIEPYEPELVDGSILTMRQVSKITDDLRSKTLAERRKIPGLKPERADVVLAGAMVLLEIMQHFSFEKVIVSDRGLRYGLLLKLLNTQYLRKSQG